jgi:hypothetical protein
VVAYCTYALRGPAFNEKWAAIGERSAADLQAKESETLPLFVAIRRHGAARELPLIVATLRALAGGRLRIERGRVVDKRGRAIAGGLDLSEEIDAAVAAELKR